MARTHFGEGVDFRLNVKGERETATSTEGSSVGSEKGNMREKGILNKNDRIVLLIERGKGKTISVVQRRKPDIGVENQTKKKWINH